jgi:heat shock protein HtpX
VDDAVARNRRHRTTLLAVGFLLAAVPLAAIAVLVGLGLLGVLVAVVLAAAVVGGLWWAAEPSALRRSGAHPATVGIEPRLHNLVDGLCAASGVEKPSLHVIEDPAPNALAVGRSVDHSAIAVTRGLLDALTRVELEAVLAHELSHIKNEDVLVDTLAVTMPATARLLHRTMGRTREPQADLAAVEMTRYPPALASALTKLRDAGTYVSAASWSTAHLWLAAPRSGSDGPASADGSDGRFDDHVPLDDRIATLQEL